MVSGHGSWKPPTTKLYITQFFFCSSESSNYSRGVNCLIITFKEKFDDIKFGKVLTKLYARLFTMEKVK